MDKQKVLETLNKLLEHELSGVVRYTHYSFMVYGYTRIPIVSWLRDKARESLIQQVPFPQRFGRPLEYAALVAHILENVMLNGETIRLDGAIRMAPR